MARGLARVLRAAFRAQHYISLVNSRIYVDWIQFFLRRYIFGSGSYPYRCRVRTPSGIVALKLYCPEDCYTVNEIFGLRCYYADAEKIFVDFGANIGISAAYFLSRNSDAYVYCFEPLPENIQKLRCNLAPFSGRFTLCEAAVADYDGEITFRVESTGRYSGIDNTYGELRRFPCVAASRVLEEILARHARIDLLKIDVEGAEVLFMPKLDARILDNIGLICVEGRDVISSPNFRRSRSVSGVLRYSRIVRHREHLPVAPSSGAA